MMKWSRSTQPAQPNSGLSIERYYFCLFLVMRKLELSEPFIYMISGKKTFTSGIHFSNKWDSAYWCPGLSASVYTFYRHHIHTHTHTHTHSLPCHSKPGSDSLHSHPRLMRCIFQLGSLLNKAWCGQGNLTVVDLLSHRKRKKCPYIL